MDNVIDLAARRALKIKSTDDTSSDRVTEVLTSTSAHLAEQGLTAVEILTVIQLLSRTVAQAVYASARDHEEYIRTQQAADAASRQYTINFSGEDNDER